MTSTVQWSEIAARAEEDIDLAEAALVIAAEEYRDLDVLHYLKQIDEMAATLKRRLRRDIPTSETIIALNRYLFDELGFSGSQEYVVGQFLRGSVPVDPDINQG